MSEDLYLELLDNLFDGVYYVDRNRVITFWNKASERLTGYGKDEVLGKACSDNILKHIDSHGRELCVQGCPLHATMADGKMREALLYLHHKDGHRVPVHIRVSPLMDEQGNVIGGIEVFSDGTQSLQTLEELEHLKNEIFIDPLLKIGNRRYAEMIFQTRLYELNAFNVPCGVVFLDVDNFKEINDTFGHLIGDRVLLMVSRSIASVLRGTDTLIRWGGDEMLIFLPNVTPAGLKRITERIRVFVENSFLMIENQKVAVTVSMGSTLLNKQDTLESLSQRMDTLLYQSKRSGKNRSTIG